MEKIAFTLYFAGIVAGVLFFGAIHTWAYTLVFLIVIAASLLLFSRRIVRDKMPSQAHHEDKTEGSRLCLYWIKTDLDPLFFLFFAFLVFQMLPLPQGLVGLISPEAKIAAQMSQPAQGALDSSALDAAWRPLAPYIYPVRMSLVRWIVYGLLFFGLIRCLNSRRRVETAVVVLILLGSLDALYGILQTYSSRGGYIWWFKSNAYGRDVSGTFLNRNLFAGFMEMTITLAIAYAAALAGQKKQSPGGSTSTTRRHAGALRRSGSFKKRLLAFFPEETHHYKRILVVFAGGVMGLGLILSSSRGGIIATTAALLLMGIIFYVRKSERRTGRIILILFAVAMVFALHAGIDYTVKRFRFFDEGMAGRRVMAEKTIVMFKDYPLVGVGIGNFRHAYGKYQDPEDKNLYVDYAHNDYAQFLSEAGVVGALLLLAGIGWYAFRTLRLWRRKTDPFAVYLGIAPFVALFAIAIHAYSDYNLHRPAHMMALITLIAIGCAALRLNETRDERLKFPERPDFRHADSSQTALIADYPAVLIPLRPGGGVLLAGAIGLMLWSGVWTVRHFIAETYCNTDINITMNLEPNPPAERVRKAIDGNPGNAFYRFKLAGALMRARDARMQGRILDHEGWRQSHDPIIAHLERAIRLDPLNPEYHVRLAWEYSYLWDRPDYAAKWLPAGDVCLYRAAYFAGDWPRNPKLHYDMGNYWTMRAKFLRPKNPESEIAWTKAMHHYRKGMEVEGLKELPKDVQAYMR
jgi:O-antigen ligase